MMVILILKGRLSGKNKDDPSILGKFSEMDLSTTACNLGHALLF